MAPEQTTPSTIDRRADLFATGVVLWECLASRRLFGGQSDGEVLRRLLSEPIPRLKHVARDIPPALDAVCQKALQRDPDARFASAAEFAEALEEAAGPIGIAGARSVAQFLRKWSGAKIEALKEQTRDVITADTSSQTSAVRRRHEITDPARRIRPDEREPTPEASSGPKSLTPPPTSAPPPPPVAVTLALDLDEDAPVVPMRSRAPLWMLAGFTACALAAVLAFVALQPHPNDAHYHAHRRNERAGPIAQRRGNRANPVARRPTRSRQPPGRASRLAECGTRGRVIPADHAAEFRTRRAAAHRASPTRTPSTPAATRAYCGTARVRARGDVSCD